MRAIFDNRTARPGENIKATPYPYRNPCFQGVAGYKGHFFAPQSDQTPQIMGKTTRGQKQGVAGEGALQHPETGTADLSRHPLKLLSRSRLVECFDPQRKTSRNREGAVILSRPAYQQPQRRETPGNSRPLDLPSWAIRLTISLTTTPNDAPASGRTRRGVGQWFRWLRWPPELHPATAAWSIAPSR